MDGNKLTMSKFLLIVILLWCNTTVCDARASNTTNCTNVTQLYESHRHKGNIEIIAISGVNTSLCCDGERVCCCSREMEAVLQQAAVKEFKQSLHNTSLYMIQMLSEKVQFYSASFELLITKAENRTYHLMSGGTLGDRTPPVHAFFTPLRTYLLNHTDINMRESFEKLFNQLFSEGSEELCLRQALQEIANELIDSISVARLFLDSLQVALDAISNASSYGNLSADCVRAIAKLRYCSMCQGYPSEVPACVNYCYNVYHGCLSSAVDLNGDWNELVEALDLLASHMLGIYNFERHLQEVDRRILATITGPNVYLKSGDCRLLKRSAPDEAASFDNSGRARDRQHYNNSVVTDILNFMKTLRKSKGFFYELGETMCMLKYPEEPPSAQACWNGHTIAMYEFPVVGKDYDTQVKDNPEVKVAEVKDTVFVEIGRRLAEKKKLLNSKASRALMQRDEAADGGDDQPELYEGMESWSVESWSKKRAGLASGDDWNSDDEDFHGYSASGSGDYYQVDKQPPYNTGDKGHNHDDDITFDPPYSTPGDVLSSAPSYTTGLSITFITIVTTTITAMVIRLNG